MSGMVTNHVIDGSVDLWGMVSGNREGTLTCARLFCGTCSVFFILLFFLLRLLLTYASFSRISMIAILYNSKNEIGMK